jgi:hypothetical protein
MFSLQKNRRTRGPGMGGEEMGKGVQTIYIHVSKWKNNNIKGERKRKRPSILVHTCYVTYAGDHRQEKQN